MASDLDRIAALHLAVGDLTEGEEITRSLLASCSRDEVRQLLDAKSEEDGSTALHMAADKGTYSTVSLLLSYGANFEAQDNENRRPIDLAQDSQIRQILHTAELESRFAELNFQGLNERQSKDFEATLRARNAKGLTTLQLAIINSDVEAIERIAEMRIYKKVYPPMELLCEAASFGQYSAVIRKCYGELMRLCDEDVELEARVALSEGTMLMSAAREMVKIYKGELPHFEVIEETLEVLEFEGEEEEVNENARYHRALYTNQKRDLRSFLEILEMSMLAPIAILSKLLRSVYLGAAAQRNDMSMVEECLAGNSDVNFQDTNGWTPLHHAVNNDNEALVKLLLKNGGDASIATSKNKKTPLHVAVKRGNARVVGLLLAGENFEEYLDAKCEPKGWTALHLAAKMGRLDLVKSLLAKGADVRVKDKKDKIARELAEDRSVVEFLKLAEGLYEKAETDKAKIVRMMVGTN